MWHFPQPLPLLMLEGNWISVCSCGGGVFVFCLFFVEVSCLAFLCLIMYDGRKKVGGGGLE